MSGLLLVTRNCLRSPNAEFPQREKYAKDTSSAWCRTLDHPPADVLAANLYLTSKQSELINLSLASGEISSTDCIRCIFASVILTFYPSEIKRELDYVFMHFLLLRPEHTIHIIDALAYLICTSDGSNSAQLPKALQIWHASILKITKLTGDTEFAKRYNLKKAALPYSRRVCPFYAILNMFHSLPLAATGVIFSDAQRIQEQLCFWLIENLLIRYEHSSSLLSWITDCIVSGKSFQNYLFEPKSSFIDSLCRRNSTMVIGLLEYLLKIAEEEQKQYPRASTHVPVFVIYYFLRYMIYIPISSELLKISMNLRLKELSSEKKEGNVKRKEPVSDAVDVIQSLAFILMSHITSPDIPWKVILDHWTSQKTFVICLSLLDNILPSKLYFHLVFAHILPFLMTLYVSTGLPDELKDATKFLVPPIRVLLRNEKLFRRFLDLLTNPQNAAFYLHHITVQQLALCAFSFDECHELWLRVLSKTSITPTIQVFMDVYLKNSVFTNTTLSTLFLAPYEHVDHALCFRLPETLPSIQVTPDVLFSYLEKITDRPPNVALWVHMMSLMHFFPLSASTINGLLVNLPTSLPAITTLLKQQENRTTDPILDEESKQRCIQALSSVDLLSVKSMDTMETHSAL